MSYCTAHVRFGGKADNAAYDLVVLCEVFRDHCIGLADCASFVSGFSQNRIGDFCPHALAFGVIGLLGVAFGVFAVHGIFQSPLRAASTRLY